MCHLKYYHNVIVALSYKIVCYLIIILVELNGTRRTTPGLYTKASFSKDKLVHSSVYRSAKILTFLSICKIHKFIIYCTKKIY